MKVTYKTLIVAAGVSLVMCAGVVQFKEAERADVAMVQAKQAPKSAITVIKGKKAKMADYTASGSSVAEINGTPYAESGTVNGKPRYVFDTTTDKYAYWTGSQWRVGIGTDALNASTYFSNASSSATLPLTGWAAAPGLGTGQTPPTFALVVAPSTNNSAGFFALADSF